MRGDWSPGRYTEDFGCQALQSDTPRANERTKLKFTPNHKIEKDWRKRQHLRRLGHHIDHHGVQHRETRYLASFTMEKGRSASDMCLKCNQQRVC